MTGGMASSLTTLERIIEHDKVDDDFRRYVLWKKILSNLLGCLAGAGGVAYSVAESVASGIDVERCLLGGASIAVAGSCAYHLSKALKTRKAYLTQTKEGFQGNGFFYYIDGNVTGRCTAVERVYGRRIRPADSLSDIEEPVIMLPEGYSGPPDTTLRFLDHLVVKDFTVTQMEKGDLVGYPDDSRQSMIYENGSFILERLGQRRMMSFGCRGHVHPRFMDFLRTKGTEIAMLYKDFEWGEEDVLVPFTPEKIYCPHP